jgi:hypothetical protein
MLAILSLLSPLFGILGSLLPSVVKIFERKQEIKYELDMAKITAEAGKYTAEVQYDIEAIKANAIERQSLYDHDKSLDGGKFINALRASIRPIITYSFFLLFVAVKTAAAYVMIKNGQDIPTMLDAVWDVDTMSLFSTIIAFWFGSRVMEKQSRINAVVSSSQPQIIVKTKVPTQPQPLPSKPKRPAGMGRDK